MRTTIQSDPCVAASHRTRRSTAQPTAPRGFTLVEILVVIGIVVLLVALLLPALAGVRTKALETQTLSAMQDFSKACDFFFQEHGQYPGIVPDDILANNPIISSTQNAMLHLMGGYVRETDVGTASFNADYNAPDWTELNFGGFRVKVNLGLLGAGPVINGRQYSPYLTPVEGQLRVVQGAAYAALTDLPTLIDAWGQPLAYVRRARPIGPLTGPIASQPQFYLETISPYIESESLGEFGKRQLDGGATDDWSVLNDGGNRYDNFAQIVQHQALPGTPRGEYVIISAGRDGIFFSRYDGPGSASDPIGVISVPALVEEYNDLVVVGGG